MQINLLWIEMGLTIAGIILLTMSLVPVRLIIQQLQSDVGPAGQTRGRWKILSIFIFIFIAGYIHYIFFHVPYHVNSITDFIVSVIFFSGAIFVFMICSLSVKTAFDLRQIYILEQEIITDPLMGILEFRVSQ
ncbi:MAG: hypothetical protein ABIJ50_11425 [Pseudomonadota bacterium]